MQGEVTTDQPEDDRPSGEQEFIDRRSGQDRRRGGERRHGGRRYRRVGTAKDRRSGRDRRARERRSGLERRISKDPRYRKPRPKTDAPPVYSADEVARVQRELSRPGYGTRCPVCDGSFTLGPVDHRGTESVRQVSCADCGRSAVVTNCLLARVMVLTRIEALRALIREILTGAGHEVLEPPHTGAAVQLYRENPADVVIMDTFALTEMDGQEFIRQLRTESWEPRVLVLAARPSYRLADPSAMARQLGATNILRMPFTREDLLRALKEARQ